MRKHAGQEALQDAARQIENEEKQERARLQVQLLRVIPACLRDGQVHCMSAHLTAAVASSDSQLCISLTEMYCCCTSVWSQAHCNAVSYLPMLRLMQDQDDRRKQTRQARLKALRARGSGSFGRMQPAWQHAAACTSN